MDRTIQFLASDDSVYRVSADQWKKVLTVDPGATFVDPPCGCCKSLLVFAWAHCPKCGGTHKQMVNRMPNWDAFCLDCGHVYSIRSETEKYDSNL